MSFHKGLFIGKKLNPTTGPASKPADSFTNKETESKRQVSGEERDFNSFKLRNRKNYPLSKHTEFGEVKDAHRSTAFNEFKK